MNTKTPLNSCFIMFFFFFKTWGRKLCESQIMRDRSENSICYLWVSETACSARRRRWDEERREERAREDTKWSRKYKKHQREGKSVERWRKEWNASHRYIHSKLAESENTFLFSLRFGSSSTLSWCFTQLKMVTRVDECFHFACGKLNFLDDLSLLGAKKKKFLLPPTFSVISNVRRQYIQSLRTAVVISLYFYWFCQRT